MQQPASHTVDAGESYRMMSSAVNGVSSSCLTLVESGDPPRGVRQTAVILPLESITPHIQYTTISISIYTTHASHSQLYYYMNTTSAGNYYSCLLLPVNVVLENHLSVLPPAKGAPIIIEFVDDAEVGIS